MGKAVPRGGADDQGSGADGGFHDVPVLDDVTESRLRDALDGDGGIWRVFVQDFLAQLPVTTGRLRQALTTGDGPGAMRAVLALRTSCEMVGAERLAGFAMQLEHSLRAADKGPDAAAALPQLAAAQLPRILRGAHVTEALLVSHLPCRPGWQQQAAGNL
jgi:HPt (histidine-containing phosphotransfer) domain-containing protein